ncbi:MAG: hypothetical protein J6V06_09640 [Clostridia bacterium]|nr:hypothetical protein [Clostridia bacterium]MBO7320265.1 hypothetical protein [Clostridia bacterium]
MAVAYLAILLGIPYMMFEGVFLVFQIGFLLLKGSITIEELADIIKNQDWD